MTFRGSSASAGGCQYTLHRLTDPPATDLDGDGARDTLVRIGAGRAMKNEWLFAYTVTGGKPRLIGFVSASLMANPDPGKAYDLELVGIRASGGQVSLDQFMFVDGERRTVTRTFRHTGGGFAPSRPVPDSRVDRRP